jgi:SAM-dependent methyltransferase
MAAVAALESRVSYLDTQSLIGVTKHFGGIPATDELAELCHVRDAGEVLYAGCGIGVGSAYLARQYGCNVVAVDVSPQMIAWARLRAQQEGISDRIEFVVADICDLPLAEGRFDVVLVESVLSFVADKELAIRECVRVARPGGFVGLNECYFMDTIAPELEQRAQTSLGTEVLSKSEWEALWQQAPMQDLSIRWLQIDAGQEVRRRIEWIGWPWLLRAWGRALKMMVERPALRQALREQLDTPLEVMKQTGYALLAGRRPVAAAVS